MQRNNQGNDALHNIFRKNDIMDYIEGSAQVAYSNRESQSGEYNGNSKKA